MLERESLCRRIDENLKNLKREIDQLDDRKRLLMGDTADSQTRIENYKSQLAQAYAASGGSSRARVRGSFTTALTVFGAIASNSEVSKLQAKLRTEEQNLVRIQREIQEVDRLRNDKLFVVRHQQDQWSRLDCFDLGYSHEVLNIN